MLTRRQLFPLAAATAAAFALPGIPRSRAQATTLRIGWQKNGVLALAKRTGALEKRLADKGVTVSWAEFTSGPPLLEALGANALDFGPTGDVPPLFAQAAGGNLVYVATQKGALTGSAILVKANSPIQNIADLKGKRLAFKRGSSAHNFVVKALRTASLTLADVGETDLSPPDAAAAFANDSIDAWAIWDPYFAIAEKDPDTRVLTTTKGIVDSWSFFFANTDFAKANPEIVVDVIDELAKVGKWSQSHLEETAAALSEITGVPLDVQKVALSREGTNLGNLFPLTEATLAYQQALADEFYDLKIIPRKLTIRDIVWYPPNT